MGKSSIDTKGKIFGLVAWVHILLVGIFSVLTTGKVNTHLLLPIYLLFLPVIIRIIFWSKKKNGTGKIVKTIREGSQFSFFQQKLRLRLTVLEMVKMVTSTDDPGAWQLFS